MKLRSFVVSRPIFSSILLAIIVLTLPSLLIPYWYTTIHNIQRHVKSNSSSFCSDLESEIEKTANLLQPINSSTANLARILSSSLDGRRISYSEMEKLVVPLLFQGYSSIPYLSQISYVGLEGLFFSYYRDGNTTFSLYSNSTYEMREKDIVLYTQPVDPNTGKLYGASSVSSLGGSTSMSLLQEAFNRTQGYASMGTKWNNVDRLFLSTTRINGTNGVVSLGFSVEAITEFFTSFNPRDGILYMATKEGEVLVEGMKNAKIVVYGNSVSFQLLKENGDELRHSENVSCQSKDNVKGSNLNIDGRNSTIYCSSIDILGLQSVYVLAFPENRLDRVISRSRNIALILLIVMVFTIMMCILSFVMVIIRAAKREMYLCAKLIRQMEATLQAERKSVNKSKALTNASHDIRASLAAITGLIEECFGEVASGSELHTNLRHMDACTKDLLGILNSVLDTSKIEAGKMQLEEEEFDLGQLLEDVVDLYHPLGMKKGIDIVLDPYDGSVIKFSNVRGDRGKLKQILCNLLSNSIKFTTEGHVNVRAWVQKPSLQHTIIASNKKGVLENLRHLILKNKEESKDMEAIDRLGVNPSGLEFVFEVDDSGKGIPKEKQESVFENYVQVKETALGQGGTGLGLGIVQSLVRLMGGDISIVDKKIGEKGTCFRFSVFLTPWETVFSVKTREEDDMKLEIDDQQPKLTIRIPSKKQIVSSPSPRLAVRTPSPKVEPSRVVLLLQDDQRRVVTKKFMESLGIKVLAVKQWDQLPLALHTIMEKQSHLRYSRRGRSEINSAHESLSLSQNSSNGDKDITPNFPDRRDCMLSVFKKMSLRSSSGLVLLVIDENAGPFQEIRRIISDFRKELQISRCRVVWLKKSLSHNIGPRDYDFNRNDVTITKPFHGGRLYDIIKLLPEFGGMTEDLESDTSTPSSTGKKLFNKTVTENSLSFLHGILGESQEKSKSRGENSRTKSLSPTQSGNYSMPKSSQSNIQGKQIRYREIQEACPSTSSDKPLFGKRILVAEDNAMLGRMAMKNLLRLGASVELCENGKEAFERVHKNLDDQRKQGSSNNLPYHYILMDCEMPIMNGYEAARKIREMEKQEGIHTPIIALSANTKEEGLGMAIEAGMDGYLTKPLKEAHLMEAIRSLHSR